MIRHNIGWLRRIAAASLLGLALVAHADDDDHDNVKALREAGDILPLQQIIESVNRDQPGKIVEVEFEHEQGKYVYEVKTVDNDGRVHELYYDARTGAPVTPPAKD